MRARSFSHVGITVSNFNRAVQFYWEVFGCPLVGVADTPSERVRTFFGVDAPAPHCKIGWIRVPGGGVLEIFAFEPQQAGGRYSVEPGRVDALLVQRAQPGSLARAPREPRRRVPRPPRAFAARSFVLFREGFRRQSHRVDGSGLHVPRPRLARTARWIPVQAGDVQAGTTLLDLDPASASLLISLLLPRSEVPHAARSRGRAFRFDIRQSRVGSNPNHEWRHPGHGGGCDRRGASQRERGDQESRHQYQRAPHHRRRGPLYGAAASARALHGHDSAQGVFDVRAGRRRAHGRPEPHAPATDDGVDRRADGDRHRHAGDRNDAKRRRLDPEREGHRDAPDPGPEVRGLPDVDAGRERRPGAGRRRDLLCRTARRLQQRESRRRRLQQRLFRRAGRRTARPD